MDKSGKRLKAVCFFSEMELYEDSGSVKDYLSEKADYDKEQVISYLKSQKKYAICPRAAIDCVTGKEISPDFAIYNDGEYEWCDFLIYHIEQYNIRLPSDFLEHISKRIT